MQYIKLNTNESPYPPSPSVLSAVMSEVRKLRLYSDPEVKELTALVAELYGVPSDSVLMTNGSDEILNFAFMAFCDSTHPIVFPDITYGFYPVFAELGGIPYRTLPLKEDFSVDPTDYMNIGENIVLANPNAPTGLALPVSDIEAIVKSNPDSIVIIDEAYVDFGAESAVPLVKKYSNLIVTGTFSKSRSMAGARIGFGIAHPELIRDMNTIKYSTNPYNINRLSAAAACAAVRENDYYMQNCKRIIENREWTAQKLSALGFTVIPSSANFIFAKSDEVGGEELYLALKARGILVRHFSAPRICEYNRITVGTEADMSALVDAIECVLEEKRK